MKKTTLTAAVMSSAAILSFAQNTRVAQLADGASANTFMLRVSYIEPVDLGLTSGTKWANMNIGASKPGDYGYYFMWGHTTDCSNIECNYDNCVTDGVNLEDWQGNAKYDAATANWGATWATPDSAQMSELINECNWEWTTDMGSLGINSGYKVTSKTNGNYIFLPAGAGQYGSNVYGPGSNGNYWSSTPPANDNGNAYFLGFSYDSNGGTLSTGEQRYPGYLIRPVLNQ